MNQITFRKTSNVFLNAGIIALHRYLEELIEEEQLPFKFEADNFRLSADQLVIEDVPNVLTVLEYIYYNMLAKDVYDTSTQDALDKKTNAYYIEAEDRFVLFPKMNTYGVAALITNNAAGKTKEKANTVRQSTIKKNEDAQGAVLIDKFEAFFEEQSIKLQSQLYLNEPYTKITRLPFDNSAYFKAGKKQCYLTGAQRKKLISIKSTSPFISGVDNFNSFKKPGAKDVSWEVAFLSRFAPKLSFYMYIAGLDSLTGFILSSDNLLNLNTHYQRCRSFFKDMQELRTTKFMSNFKLFDFKSEGNQLAHATDYTWKSEVAFMLLYTLYKTLLSNKSDQAENSLIEFKELFKKEPLALAMFRADKYAGTMRPSSFDFFDNFLFLMRLFEACEQKQISMQGLLSSLKFQEVSHKNKENSYQLERIRRGKVLDKVLKKQPIIELIEGIFYDSFMYLTHAERRVLVRYKDFTNLLQFTRFYESQINQDMDANIQDRAIKLGTSIGQGILRAEDAESFNEKQQNAKKGRTYIINLHKARTFEQFREALIRLQKRYQIIISNELLENLNEENYQFVKQFTILSALNNLNSFLNKKNTSKNATKSE